MGIETLEKIGVVEIGAGTDNIQAAVAALPSTGGIIRLKPGTYTITTSVLANKTNIRFIGSGLATILKVTGGVAAFTVSSSGTSVVDLRIQLDNSAGAVDGILVTAGSDQLFRNVVFENLQGVSPSPNAFIRFTAGGGNTGVVGCTGTVSGGSMFQTVNLSPGVGRVIFSRCQFVGTERGYRTDADRTIFGHCRITVGIAFGFDIVGDDCIVDGCVVEGSGVGVGIDHSGSRGIVSNTQILDFVSGITLSGSGVKLSGCNIRTASGAVSTVRGILAIGSDVELENCTVDGGGTGIAGSTGIEFILGIRAKVIGCTVANFAAGILAGMRFSVVTDALVSACNVHDVAADAVSIESGPINFSGGKIRDCTGDGIKLVGVTGCIVNSTLFTGIGGTEIIESAAADKNIIDGNSLVGGTITTVGVGTVTGDNVT